MVKINKRCCSGVNGEVQNATPLAEKNTQEYQDTIGMAQFKLGKSIDYLEEPFDQLANSIKRLWLSEGDTLPRFVNKFADCWSSDDYATFCEQVKLWALDHDKDPFEELRRRVHELLLCDKKLFQLLTVTKLLRKSGDSERVLFDQQANVQQLCNEIGEEDDQLFIANDDFKQASSQFGRLKGLVYAMRLHSNYLVNQRLTRRKMVNVDLAEEAKIISKPVQSSGNSGKSNAKEDDDELEP
ncbi:hypothetical protein H9564_08410 [Limosilactobacillus sp. Sa3CUN2]|uniref:Uncharacterized protein n=1 Tax=Limosilactobacillus avistercoris TaxID=2762243 RepID=A0ABR8PEK6_9LACO|nr:hypothetical protein [Limosilactobacillus avistercoris]MBD7895703.1 hypothetical protein [Limosilactobacillus avistercoris]